MKACALFEKNDAENAKECFKKALEIDSNNSKTLNRIGVCCSHSGKTDDAIKYFNRAIESDSSNIYPLLNKAKLYVNLDNFEDCEICFDKVNEISPDNMDYLI